MKLTHLLEQHNKFKDQGLPGSFGDGYLVVNNRFFRQVRSAALAAGYSFAAEKNDAYETFPLLQLESILLSKILPYANNVSSFEQMNPAQLAALSREDLEGNLKKNFVFHEACHGIVRNLANQVLGPMGKAQDLESQRTVALRMLVEESCANTLELLGIVDVHDQAHRIFFEMNSYMENFENRTHLKNAFAEIGEKIVIKFMFLSYLQANFLRERITDSDFQEMVLIAAGDEKLDLKKLKTLRALGRLAFQLSERFRKQTTSFHLRLMGIKTPTSTLFNFNFLTLIKTAALTKFMNQWVDIFSQ